MPLTFALLLRLLSQERALRILDLRVEPQRLKIDIRAGTDGVWGLLLRALDMDTKSGFVVDSTGCRRTRSGLLNISRTFAPRHNLSEAVYFLVRPIATLMMGLVFTVATVRCLWTAFSLGFDVLFLAFSGISATISLVCLVKFFVADRIAVLGVVTNAGTIVSIKLKVQAGDFRTLQQAIGILETVVAQTTGGSSAASSSPGVLDTPNLRHDDDMDDLDDLENADEQLDSLDEDEDDVDAPPAPKVIGKPQPVEKRIIQCPHCDANLRLNASILGSRIRCPACEEPFEAK